MREDLPSLDYKKKFQERLRKNIADMKENKTSPDYLKKVRNFIEKFELNEREIMEKYEKDEIFALFFVKDPGKQSFHEKAAAEFIKSLNKSLDIKLFQNFRNLPTGGKNALYISNGNVIDYNTRKGKSDGKSIDFYWEYNYKNKKLKFYASHKYTEASGGSQDNQRIDIESFMEGARSSRSSNEKFYAITDGEYYKDMREDLNDMHGNSHVKSISIDELAGDVAKCVKAWLKKEFGDEAIDAITKLDYIIKLYDV